jgi:Lar family restriction alleviation protein
VSDSELKNCPFCGGKTERTNFTRQTTCVDYSTFECITCGASVSSLDSPHGADAWNRRASPWRPIAEAPKDGTWLLVRGMNTVGQPMIPLVVSWNDGYGRCLGYAWRDSLTLTDVGHWIDPNAEWMTLPEPPEVKK